jgi:hypothetical protein
MPGFILNGASSPAFKAWDSFTRGYIEALFFANTPEDETWSFDDLAPETLGKIVSDCAAFQEQNEKILEAACDCDRGQRYDTERAGNDF